MSRGVSGRMDGDGASEDDDDMIGVFEELTFVTEFLGV